MKTIAFVCPWYGDRIPGGAEAALRGITDHLHAAGMDIEILTTTVRQFTADWNENYYKPGRDQSAVGIPIRRFKIRKRDTAAFDAVNAKLIAGERLTDAQEETFVREMVNSPELYAYIQSHADAYTAFVFIPYLFGTTYYGVQACPEKAVLIPCFHDEAYAYIRKFAAVYQNAAGMLFNAKPEYELARQIFDLSGVCTQIMGLGVDTEQSGDAARFRQKFGVRGPFLLYAGRKDTGKNIGTLLAYFDRYRSQNPARPLQLVLMGGGSVKIPPSAREDVHDLGFVDIQDKYDGYAAALALCQPSRNESFSFVMMESWLCRRPVLVHAQCPVTRNFVSEANGGLYFDNYAEFEGTVRYLLDHPETADRMGAQGQNYVMEHFAWDVIVEKYRTFFEALDRRNVS